MYIKSNGQISLAEFFSPFEELDSNNRWAKIANMIPWQKYEAKYAEQFCKDNGAPAISFRMAMGTLIIKQRTGHSDEEVLQDILENPYMQYLIGLHEFTIKEPFASSSITNFRKYITEEMINEINKDMFGNDKNNGGTGNGGETGNPDKSDEPERFEEPDKTNKGTIMLDSTCTPANIAYPTDVNLLNEAREKLEGIIDNLHRQSSTGIRKPRTYRQTARIKYLRFIRNRKPSKAAIRKIIGQQIRYVGRDLRNIEKQLQEVNEEVLNNSQQRWLRTIRTLYRQQKQMFETHTHTVEDRIVSIGQPHVRPIVRGKTNASVEFGAKISVSMVDGYAFVEKMSWDAYNEESTLIPAIEAYKERYGYYPEAVLADKIHRNRNNLAYCRQKGIRLSGPRLGRPSKTTNLLEIEQERNDASRRNSIEGKFGEGKVRYGLDTVMARLKNTSETVITMSFFCMNISRRLRVLFYRFFCMAEYMFGFVKYC